MNFVDTLCGQSDTSIQSVKLSFNMCHSSSWSVTWRESEYILTDMIDGSAASPQTRLGFPRGFVDPEVNSKRANNAVRCIFERPDNVVLGYSHGPSQR